MKKHLIAVALAGGLVAPAMAQNVTVYGNVDVNIRTQDSSANKSDTNLQEGALSSSVVGLRGSEDLGGGLKAEFNLEGSLDPVKGTLGSTTDADNEMFNREAWVGLSGAFGAVRIGTSDVTSAQAIDSKVSQGGDLFLYTSSEDLGTDKNNVVRYTSPKFGNFGFEAGLASPKSTVSSTGEATEESYGRITSLYAQYEDGPLGLYAGTESVKISNSYDQDSFVLGVKYAFGPLGLGFTYRDRDAAIETEKSTKGQDIWILSASYPLGNGVTAHAGYKSVESDVKQSTDGETATVALTKAMSKRTTVYAAFANFSAETGGVDEKNYILGLRHQF